MLPHAAASKEVLEAPFNQPHDFPGRQTLSHEVKLSRDGKVDAPQGYH